MPAVLRDVYRFATLAGIPSARPLSARHCPREIGLRRSGISGKTNWIKAGHAGLIAVRGEGKRGRTVMNQVLIIIHRLAIA